MSATSPSHFVVPIFLSLTISILVFTSACAVRASFASEPSAVIEEAASSDQVAETPADLPDALTQTSVNGGADLTAADTIIAVEDNQATTPMPSDADEPSTSISDESLEGVSSSEATSESSDGGATAPQDSLDPSGSVSETSGVAAGDESALIQPSDAAVDADETQSPEIADVTVMPTASSSDGASDIPQVATADLTSSPIVAGELEEADSSLSFLPRLEAPTRDNVYYYSKEWDLHYPDYVGQCTWYVLGRAAELTGIKYTAITYGWGGMFWTENNGRYPTGQTPKLGAIACCGVDAGNGFYRGHVGIVERIDPDGGWWLSEVFGGSDHLYHYMGPYYTGQDWADRNRKNYTFQGFIYILDDNGNPITPGSGSSLTTPVQTGGALGFSDCSEDDWFIRDGWIEYVRDAGIMTGTKGADGNLTGNFEPNATLTRGQVATILYRCGEPNSDATSNPESYAQTSSFSDVPGNYYYTAAIEWCLEHGIVTGYYDEEGNPTGKFGPEDSVTREQLATMVYRFGAFQQVDTSYNGDRRDLMPDVGDVTNFAFDAIGWCTSKGIITGDASYTPARINPQGLATRAQMAKIITVYMTTTH